MRHAVVAVALLAVQGVVQTQQPAVNAGVTVSDVFAGSSPCDAALRRLLRIPPDADAHLVEWTLVLHKHAPTGAPAGYHLRFRYGLTVPNRPGLGEKIVSQERKGTWKVANGTKTNPAAMVYELDGSVSLQKISDTVLHVLDEDRTLMVGDGGWSYTLSRSDGAETRVDPLTEPAETGEPRTISPVATGPTVFGVFEGRTPCQGIARELKIKVGAGCAKSKWRVTLLQHADTREPTRYKIEGTLYRSAREGSWRVERGSETDPGASVYELDATRTESALFLLRGDDNVVFFMDQQRRPLTGHAEFSYTLDRRQ